MGVMDKQYDSESWLINACKKDISTNQDYFKPNLRQIFPICALQLV